MHRPLVLRAISQTAPIDRGLQGLLFYRRSLKVLRKLPQGTTKKQNTYRWEIRLAEFENDVEPPKRGEIDSFSAKSKARLQNICLNSSADFISQMTLTYDRDQAPVDGVVLKVHLNNFLTKLRKEFQGVKYLWVLEFQRNGNPHFHVFTTIQYSPERAKRLGYMWNQTVCGSEKHLKVHQYVPNHRYKRKLGKKDKHGAFCPWEMGDGSYLAYKYLSKESQKSVPDNFTNVGRFWGATRKLVQALRSFGADEFYSLFENTLNTSTGELITAQKHINRFFRDLRNYQEKTVKRARYLDYLRKLKEAGGRYPVRKPKKYRSPIRKCCDVTVNKGVEIYEQWIRYYQRDCEVPF